MGTAKPPPSDRRISSSTERAEIDSRRWRCETEPSRAVRSAGELDGDDGASGVDIWLEGLPRPRGRCWMDHGRARASVAGREEGK